MTNFRIEVDHDHGEDLEICLICNDCDMVVYQTFEYSIAMRVLVTAEMKHVISAHHSIGRLLRKVNDNG